MFDKPKLSDHVDENHRVERFPRYMRDHDVSKFSTVHIMSVSFPLYTQC